MKVYTTVLEFIASYAASDLSDSLWSARFACPIESLQTLQKTLHDINGGNNPYVGVQGTFAETYKEARAIADKISCGCGRQ